MLRTFASSSSRAIRAARAVRFNSTQAAPQQSTAYIVERTANGTLPVYSDVKGNATRTIIRRIRGSAEGELNEYLAAGHIDPITPAPSAILKPTSRQIEVKGRWVPELKAWLEMKGF
ncbi:hypothetical protein A1Q2_04817 [Trichosporon asahii var. asahii CBS 8904]|uniref:Large ribosomal subunit protein mL49 n=2 Tax=Trichosporon asahii var. asahii TaxID=189963 RepID=K1WHJ5_TRIAC|nr:hypothetical protein A1Q1_01310 [Trichosporon asahii var. asahii CBS 2479]EJT52815.1 hypothetical protein A1Q1_01310 [Trichosporon asahii var. asahii CBS 2479]EKD00944.1 hypothetical protein A1Q2_04817 [Trichosporon asahii var. asahii CBS 8904]